MPWLYLLALSIVILIVWWALSRSAATTEIPGPEHTPEPPEGSEGEKPAGETDESPANPEDTPDEPVH